MSHCSEYIWKIYYELSQFNLNQSLTLKITSLSPCNETIKIYEKFIHILLNYSATKKQKTRVKTLPLMHQSQTLNSVYRSPRCHGADCREQPACGRVKHAVIDEVRGLSLSTIIHQ